MHGHGGFLNECYEGFNRGGWHYLMMIGVVLVIAVLILWFAKKNKGQSSKSALQLLDKRFVEGVITQEEYEKKKSILSGK